MAALALGFSMRPGQLEGRVGMVKRGVLPIDRGMTLFALRTQVPFMSVVLLMAGIAVGRGRFKQHIIVAVHAFSRLVCASQFKCSQIVIKVHPIPAFGRVALLALCPQGTLVCIICRVTGSAICRGRFKEQVFMAGFALNGTVRSLEGKIGQ